jgi:hypothetical protein
VLHDFAKQVHRVASLLLALVLRTKNLRRRSESQADLFDRNQSV